ncbi:MAG: hypothetical protein AB7I50_17545 [Vicinamibacterales bacterium]
MAENVRLYAVVHVQVLHPRVRHLVGFPSELAEGSDDTRPLPRPHVLVIEEESAGSVFLYRMTQGGKSGGDTWHQSLADAKHQADYEYGDAVGTWSEIPGDVRDARDFAVAAVRSKEQDGQ